MILKVIFKLSIISDEDESIGIIRRISEDRFPEEIHHIDMILEDIAENASERFSGSIITTVSREVCLRYRTARTPSIDGFIGISYRIHLLSETLMIALDGVGKLTLELDAEKSPRCPKIGKSENRVRGTIEGGICFLGRCHSTVCPILVRTALDL